MGEAKRRKLAGSQWADPKARNGLLAAVHQDMARTTDQTLSGVTVIFPSGETVFLSAADAKKQPDGRPS
jgi:hypothetical protein